MSALDVVLARGRVYLLVAIFMFGFGVGIGVSGLAGRLREARRTNAELQAERDARERQAEDTRISNQAAARIAERLRSDDLTISDLRRRLTDARTPVLADASPACPGHAAAAPVLSLGAVRLYDAAASGIDLPVGSCGAAGASDAACADPSGTDVVAFHDVATENAGRQRECVARLNALIDLLHSQGRDGSAAVAPGAPH